MKRYCLECGIPIKKYLRCEPHRNERMRINSIVRRRRWYLANRERAINATQRWRRKHPKWAKKINHNWYVKNRQNNHDWRIENKLRAKAWRTKNKNHIQQYHKKWSAKQREHHA